MFIFSRLVGTFAGFAPRLDGNDFGITHSCTATPQKRCEKVTKTWNEKKKEHHPFAIFKWVGLEILQESPTIFMGKSMEGTRSQHLFGY